MGVLRKSLDSVESLERVDPPAEALQQWVRRTSPDGQVMGALRGSWLGHPLHPVLVLMPIGAWLSVGVLDMFPGTQRAAQRLVLAGLFGAVPAALAGLAELRDLDPPQRRVGFVHALTNLTASVCYTASYGSRRRGNTVAGRVWAALGLAAVGVSGTLGGHLSYAQGAGVYRWYPQRQSASPSTETVPAS